MLVRYDMYGFESLSLEDAVPLVEAAIAQPLEERDSSYYAGTYFRYRTPSDRGVRLYKNRDPNTGRHVRSEYAEYALLMEIAGLPGMEEIEARLAASPHPPRLLRSVTKERDDEEDAGR
jgi:hypothetical protein